MTNPIRRIVLVANATKPESLRLAEEARARLAGRVERVELETGEASDLAGHAPDLVVVFGGDGTVLNAVRRLGGLSPLLLTVNLGRLGYLAEVAPGNTAETLERVLAGRFRVSERVMLGAHIRRGGETLWHGEAVNEFAIRSCQAGRLVRLAVTADGAPLFRLAGDGLILATPTGSTGYALSAGGPIVNPELRALVLAPICPHRLANRPLILGGDETVVIRPEETGCGLSADGRESAVVEPGAEVMLRLCARRFRLILGETAGRYDILRDKLGWAG